MIDLPHVVYIYIENGFTQFRVFTVDVENDIVIDNPSSVMTSGLNLTSHMINDTYLIGKSSTSIGVYTFNKQTLAYSFVESFDTFTYDGVSYNVSDYNLSNSKFVGKDKFVMRNNFDVVIFKFNDTTWNNVFSRFVVYHTDGISQYPIRRAVHSYNGNYIFVGGYSINRKSYNTGIFYVYRWNGIQYVNTGFIAENDDVYNHFTVEMSVTMDDRLLVLDYSITSSSSGANPEHSELLGYTFNNTSFDFNSATTVYYGDSSSNYSTRVFTFFTDFYSTVFFKQNQSSRILYFRELYDADEIRPYPSRGWINGAHVTSLTGTINSIEGDGIVVVNEGHPTTRKSTWTLPESYVSYGAGQYIAKTNKNYNNGGHFPAGAFTKLNRNLPTLVAQSTSSESDPVIFTIILPVNIILKRYDVHSRFYTSATFEGIKSWKLQASNDDFVSEIVDLDIQSNQKIPTGKFLTFNIDSNTRIFNSYRLRITANETSPFVIVSEFELWGVEQS